MKRRGKERAWTLDKEERGNSDGLPLLAQLRASRTRMRSVVAQARKKHTLTPTTTLRYGDIVLLVVSTLDKACTSASRRTYVRLCSVCTFFDTAAYSLLRQWSTQDTKLCENQAILGKWCEYLSLFDKRMSTCYADVRRVHEVRQPLHA